MNIALAQLNQTVGDIKGNAKKIISTIKKTKADIVVFPELSVTGYSPQDMLLKKSFLDCSMSALKEISGNCSNKAAIVGFPERAGSCIYNSAAVIENRQIMKIHRKICLPNYSIFDEKRWFSEGSEAAVFDFFGKKIGLSICEDIWFPETLKNQKENGAELMINISASPYSKGKIERLERVIRQRWEENKTPIIYVNQAGSQDGIVYYGHSMYFNNGRIVEKCRDFDEDVFTVKI